MFVSLSTIITIGYTIYLSIKIICKISHFVEKCSLCMFEMSFRIASDNRSTIYGFICVKNRIRNRYSLNLASM